MARIIAIDYGTKRVGLAVTDQLQLIATPLDTVHAKDLIEYLKKYFVQQETEAIVIGMPKRLDNTDTNLTRIVQDFVKYLKRVFPEMPVHLVDERFTSVIASAAMLAGGLKKKARSDKATVDKISATIILQSFLDSRQFQNR